MMYGLCDFQNPDFLIAILLCFVLGVVMGFWLGQMKYMDPPTFGPP